MSAEPAVALPEPARTLSITEEAFCSWLGKAMLGDRIEYHRGHLPTDRSRQLGPFSEADRRELSAIASRALALAEEGRLCLAQKRHGDGDYSYIAVKASGPAPALRIGGPNRASATRPTAPHSSAQPRNGKGESQCL
jgi:hypothetical protein